MTVDVHTHELARPFVVLATQNPVEFEGTYPLPEAQVDRFMMRISLGYPAPAAEAAMLGANERGDRVDVLEAVGDAAAVLAAQDAARRVHTRRGGARLRRRAARPHARRSPRRARREPARRSPPAARRQGPRAAGCPRSRASGRRPGARERGAGAPHRARARRPSTSAPRRSSPTRSPRRRRGETGMRGRRRGALGAAALGVALILLAGLFDAEPLYVPGIALVALAVIAVVWVAAAARGLQVRRVVTAARVEEGEPLLVVIEVGTGRIVPPAGEVLDPLLAEPAALGSVRRGTRVRIRARFSRRGRRLLPPPSVVVRDPLGPRRVARRRARAAGRGARAAARGHGPRPGRAGRARDERPRPARRRRRGRSRRPAPAPSRRSGLAHRLAGVRALG